MKKKFGKLYIVATPIGNLEDITLRALRVLREVDFILAEDTRTIKKLLARYSVHTPVISYHQHSSKKKINQIINLLKNNKNLALVCEAGTPGISDPGGRLIDIIYSQMGKEVKIIPIPGPSSITAALSVSGFLTQQFLFLGFLPKKKKRKKFLEMIFEAKHPVVFFESPYRLIRTLKELVLLFQETGKNPEVLVCKELTKKFEKIYRGKLKEVIADLDRGPIKGEYVIIINSSFKRRAQC